MNSSGNRIVLERELPGKYPIELITQPRVLWIV